MTAAETEVSELVLHFLGQPKVVRDEVLLQVAAPGLLSVIGFKLARTCFRCLFRIGCKARLAANARGKLHPDMRLRGRTLPRSKCKTSKCYLFLSTLYLRVAETLPHKFHGKWLRRKYKWHRRRMQGMQGSDSESSEEDAPPADALGQAREDIVAEVQHFTRYLTSGLGSDVSHLPLRYLPPGNVHELWLQFCSEHGETTASYATFHKAYKDVSHVLKFRAKGEFSECDECEILKKAIKEAPKHDMQKVLAATTDLKKHYSDVQRCRDLEETLRTIPPGSSKPVLLIITDGMDQAHWRVPRLPNFRAGKAFSSPGLSRPKCIVQGLWIFFFGVHFLIGDKVQPHDSSFIIEAVARGLEKIRETHIDTLEDIYSVATAIRTILERPSLKNFLGDVPVSVDILEGCRNWAAYYDEMDVRLEGGLLGSSNHCFLFLYRKDLPHDVQQRVLPLRNKRNQLVPGYLPHPLDVVLLQKQFLWESSMSADPKVTIPFGLARAFRTQHGCVPLLLRPTNEPMTESWLNLALALLKYYPAEQMQRTVVYLQHLAGGRRGIDTKFPRLGWWESLQGRPDVENALGVSIEPRHLRTLIPVIETRVVGAPARRAPPAR
ncbi:NHX3 [Symbiodinium sp. KB8]|nr:NHX3 [Symbiodinium sp. KB8]